MRMRKENEFLFQEVVLIVNFALIMNQSYSKLSFLNNVWQDIFNVKYKKRNR